MWVVVLPIPYSNKERWWLRRKDPYGIVRSSTAALRTVFVLSCGTVTCLRTVVLLYLYSILLYCTVRSPYKEATRNEEGREREENKRGHAEANGAWEDGGQYNSVISGEQRIHRGQKIKWFRLS